VGPRDGEISPAILDACRRGDRDALRALYEAYKDRVYSIALYFFRGDATAAGDVTQQVFLKLIDGMAKYRGDSAFSTWLYRIVVNACVDRSRRWRSETSTEPAVLDEIPAPALSHDEVVARGEVARSVQDAIATLPPKLRLPILLRYFDDLSYSEMAAALNCSIGTVSSRLSRGHRLLARKLAPLAGRNGAEPFREAGSLAPGQVLKR
jgi:RNA polymerase sigma-70 factor (ECF subfamily)